MFRTSISNSKLSRIIFLPLSRKPSESLLSFLDAFFHVMLLTYNLPYMPRYVPPLSTLLLYVARLVEALGLGAHLYADSTQLYSHFSPANSVELASRVLWAIDSIHEWISSNRLFLNTSKTQIIWLGTKHSLSKRETDWLSNLRPSLTELISVRNLGFIIDQELNMKGHITKLCVKCVRFDNHLHHQPSKLWSMPSSARESISPTAFSMGQMSTSMTVSNRSWIRLHVWSSELANMIPFRRQFGVTFTGSRFRFVFDTSSTPSRATAWLAVHRSTWSSYATLWMTFQQGATFGRRFRFSSWSLDIGRNDPGGEVSPSPHHSGGTYFRPTSDFSTTTINFSGWDLKFTICLSPCYATEDRCQQCDLYYYYYYLLGSIFLLLFSRWICHLWSSIYSPQTKVRLDFRKFSLFSRIIDLRNSLPFAVVAAGSFFAFKARLKLLLF